MLLISRKRNKRPNNQNRNQYNNHQGNNSSPQVKNVPSPNFSGLFRPATGQRWNDYAKSLAIKLYNPNGMGQTSQLFQKYPREKILQFLQDPSKNSSQLIDASIYLYSVSPHYMRAVNYFGNMLTFDYDVAQYKSKDYDEIDTVKFKKSYFKILDLLELMAIRQTFKNVAKVAVLEGVYYGYEVQSSDSYMLYKFPHNYCKVTSWEDGVALFSLDMSYFDQRQVLLESIGGDMQKLYNLYKSDSTNEKWQELDGKSSCCILANETSDYISPMLASSFVDIYGIQDYKELALTREEQELYKMLSLKYPMNDNGAFLMDEPIAREFYNQMGDQLPSFIGLALNPFEMKEVNFPQSSVDRDSTAKAESNFWSAAGISGMLFNNSHNSGAALQESHITDMCLMLPILRSLERWLNKKLKNQSGTYKFKTVFHDSTHHTRRVSLDSVRKDEQYGSPVKLLSNALQGRSVNDALSIAFIENDVLDLLNKFIPPKSANTQTTGTSGDDGGRPENADSGEVLSESGQQTQDNGDNDEASRAN